MSAKTISRPVVLALVLLGLSPSARARVVDVTTQRVHFKGYAAVSSSGEALLLLWDQLVGNGDVELCTGSPTSAAAGALAHGGCSRV